MQSHYTTPIIKPGLDYVVIGTKGGHRGIVPNEHVPKIIDAMNGVKALRAEVVSKDSKIINANYPAMSIEQLTIASVNPQDWQPLPFTNKDGRYWSDVAQDYGIPLEVFEMVVLTQSLSISNGAIEYLVQDPNDFISRNRSIVSRAVNGMEGSVHHGELDYLRGLKNIHKYNELLFSDSDGRMPLALSIYYMMFFVSEYEILKPDVEKMRSDYPNEKVAVMCGGKHVDFIEDVLKGNPIDKPHIGGLKLAVSDDKRAKLEEMLDSFK